MSLGVDGALVLAITSAIAWAKRADVVEGHVYRLVHLVSGDEEKAKRAAASVGASMQPPSLLLKGFDLEQPSTSHSSPAPRVPHRHAVGSVEVPEGLPRDAADWSAAQRRRLAVDANRRQDASRLVEVMKWLADHEEWEGAVRLLQSYAEVCIGFTSDASKLSPNARNSDENVKMNPNTVMDVRVVEHALRAILSFVPAHVGEAQVRQRQTVAIDTVLRTGVLPPNASLLVTMLHGASLRSAAASQLSDIILTDKEYGLNPHVLSTLLTETCQAVPTPPWECALTVYSSILQDAQNRSHRAEHLRLPTSFRRRDRNAEAAPVAAMSKSALPVRHVYHVLLPMLCKAGRFAESELVARDMLAREPEVKDEVLLEALQYEPAGRQLVERILQHVEPPSSATDQPVQWEIAAQLFAAKPSPRTLNSFLSVVLSHPKAPGAYILCKNALIQVEDQLSSEDWLHVTKTVEAKDCWKTALALASHVMRSQSNLRKCEAVFPHHRASVTPLAALSKPMLRRSMWSPALCVLTTAMTRWTAAVPQHAEVGRGSRSEHRTDAFSACVFSAFAMGKHAAGHFWLDRAHRYGCILPATLYDAAIAASATTSWLPALEVLCKARQVGAVCSEEGVQSILSSAERSRKTADVLRVMWLTDSARWVP